MSHSHDPMYLDLMQRILDHGIRKESRAGATLDLFGAQLRFPLDKGFPLLTTKKVFYRGIFEELLWFLRGETNVKPLQERDVRIWDEWADADGDLGPVYGKQWRAFGGLRYPLRDPDTPRYREEQWKAEFAKLPPERQFDLVLGIASRCGRGGLDLLFEAGKEHLFPQRSKEYRADNSPLVLRGEGESLVDYAWRLYTVWRDNVEKTDPLRTGYEGGFDQIGALLTALRNSPGSRRHIVTAWDPTQIGDMRLPPCHCLFQFDVTDGRLSCQLYQRSADYFLGVPFNIASYAALTHLIAFELGLEVGDFVHTFGSVHLYENHLKQARLQLSREPRPSPRLTIEAEGLIAGTNGGPALPEADASVFKVHNYDPHPAIKATVAV